MRLIALALGWTAGILLAANNPQPSPVPWALLFILALLALWLGWQTSRRLWLLALAALTLGGLRIAVVPTNSILASFNGSGGLTVEGRVIAAPDVREGAIHLRVDVDTVTQGGQTFAVDGLALVQAPITNTAGYGDFVAASGILTTPQEYDTFSYADYLARSGVFSMMQHAAVEVTGISDDSAYGTLLNIRTRAAQNTGSALPEPYAGLLNGIVLGDTSGIAPGVAGAFSVVGASHVLAISGFNMAVLAGLVMRVLGSFTKPGRAAVAGLLTIAVYTVLVGANAAVVRAALMSGLLVTAPLLRRKTYLPASLAFVVLVMSALNPMVLWDIGFQLSLFAVLGLALFSEPFARGLRRWMPFARSGLVNTLVGEPLAVALAVQVATLPLTLAVFGRLSPALLPVNLLIAPVQAPLLLLGGGAVLAGLMFTPLAQSLYWLVLPLLAWTSGIVRLFAGMPFASVEVSVDPRVVALYYVGLMGGAVLAASQPAWVVQMARVLRGRALTAVAAGLAALVLSLAGAVILSRPDGKLHVWMLDVGHSNAVLMQTPGGAHVLVDGGRFPARLLTAIGDRTPFTDREIELLVITQPDDFDTGALPAVLSRYTIGAALVNGQPSLSESYTQIQDAIAPYPVVTALAGTSIAMDDGTLIEVLNPQTAPELDDNLSDGVLVLRVSYGEVSFLLPGDLSMVGQESLLASGQWPLADVMQLPAHGGTRSLSDAFLAAVQPQVVLFQSDRANRLGDPNPDTLALLGDMPVFRTDEREQTIHAYTDGLALWVE